MDYLKDKFKDKYINFLDNTKKKLFTIKDIAISIVVLIIFCIMLLSFVSDWLNLLILIEY